MAYSHQQLRTTAAAGVLSGGLMAVAGVLHPKGTNDVGTLDEWLTRVHRSDLWVLDHYLLLCASLLALVASVGIAHTLREPAAEVWSRLGLLAMVVATAVATLTFLVDGPVVKQMAGRWHDNPTDAAVMGSAWVIVKVGFILVAGLQLSTALASAFFGYAGIRSQRHPRWIGGIAVLAAAVAAVSGSVHYLFGPSTPSVSAVYISNGLFATWLIAMGIEIWRAAPPTHGDHALVPLQPIGVGPNDTGPEPTTS